MSFFSTLVNIKACRRKLWTIFFSFPIVLLFNLSSHEKTMKEVQNWLKIAFLDQFASFKNRNTIILSTSLNSSDFSRNCTLSLGRQDNLTFIAADTFDI